ncbi:U6 snRNA-associated Sm LSm7 [Pelomyxa schiedti]|nr:U6 snRNA-associated Sm LSm7 [Pelomyxa schiedti]
MAKQRKESILELNQYLNHQIIVKFNGGREVRGVLKGYDNLLNLVLDECVESIRDVDDPYKITDEKRTLGLVVARGSQLMLISPAEGCEQIPNPFPQQSS